MATIASEALPTVRKKGTSLHRASGPRSASIFQSQAYERSCHKKVQTTLNRCVSIIETPLEFLLHTVIQKKLTQVPFDIRVNSIPQAMISKSCSSSPILQWSLRRPELQCRTCGISMPVLP